jgi:hypothetical protein
VLKGAGKNVDGDAQWKTRRTDKVECCYHPRFIARIRLVSEIIWGLVGMSSEDEDNCRV